MKTPLPRPLRCGNFPGVGIVEDRSPLPVGDTLGAPELIRNLPGRMIVDDFTTGGTATVQPKQTSHRWGVAYAFIALNVLILIVGIWWLTQPKTRGTKPVSPQALDQVMPETPGRAPSERKQPAPLPIREPQTEEEKQSLNRARLKLQSAKRWEATHPDKARKFAEEAIEAAPASEVAAEARQMLKNLPR